jgi:hypothetical protein
MVANLACPDILYSKRYFLKGSRCSNMFPLEFEQRKRQDKALGTDLSSIYAVEQRTKETDPKKLEKLSKLKLNFFDEHIFNASQTNRGTVTPEIIKSYAYQHFPMVEKRQHFIDYAKSRLAYFAWLGLVNDNSTSNRVLHEKVTVENSKGESKTTDRAYKTDFKYMVNTSILSFIDEFRKCKHEKAKAKKQKEIEDFKISNVHKYIYKFCKEGEFSLKRYRAYISQKMNGENLEREMAWKKASCDKLARTGYFNKLDDDTYRITNRFTTAIAESAVKESDRQKTDEVKVIQFNPGINHKRLLRFAKNGILKYKDIEKSIKALPLIRQSKETVMKNGMLRKLTEAGYLEIIESGKDNDNEEEKATHPLLFKLTPKAFEFLKNNTPIKNNNPNPAKPIEAKEGEIKGKEIKITAFDVANIINPSKEGMFTKETLGIMPKKDSIEKRITTLVAAGLLSEEAGGWRIKDELYDRAKVRGNINKEHEISHSRQHSLDCLTVEQKKTLADVKDFYNLSGSQILEHIYSGNEKLYKGDIDYLVKKEILARDELKDVYVLTKRGSKLACEITGDLELFGSKINSKRDELRHDLLLYSAYKDLEKELKAEGKTITMYKTDRKMKSEDMKRTGKMREQYSDLFVEFQNEVTGEKGTVNIEVDIGYSEKVIARKMKIPNLRWYTNKQIQKEKVLRKAKNMYVKIIHDDYWHSHSIKS